MSNHLAAVYCSCVSIALIVTYIASPLLSGIAHRKRSVT